MDFYRNRLAHNHVRLDVVAWDIMVCFYDLIHSDHTRILNATSRRVGYCRNCIEDPQGTGLPCVAPTRPETDLMHQAIVEHPAGGLN